LYGRPRTLLTHSKSEPIPQISMSGSSEYPLDQSAMSVLTTLLDQDTAATLSEKGSLAAKNTECTDNISGDVTEDKVYETLDEDLEDDEGEMQENEHNTIKHENCETDIKTKGTEGVQQPRDESTLIDSTHDDVEHFYKEHLLSIDPMAGLSDASTNTSQEILNAAFLSSQFDQETPGKLIFYPGSDQINRSIIPIN